MPAVHCVHAPAPLVALNDPSAHSSHVLCPAAAWNVPGLHGVWSAAPVEQDERASLDDGLKEPQNATVRDTQRGLRVSYTLDKDAIRWTRTPQLGKRVRSGAWRT